MAFSFLVLRSKRVRQTIACRRFALLHQRLRWLIGFPLAPEITAAGEHRSPYFAAREGLVSRTDWTVEFQRQSRWWHVARGIKVCALFGSGTAFHLSAV